MAYTNDPARESSIIAQSAAKAAAELYAGTGDLNGFLDAAATIHEDILRRAKQHLPAQPVPQPVPQPVQAAPAVTPQQAVQNVNQVFGITSASPEEELWADVFNNPQDWYDNHTDPSRSTLAGGNGPDFKHKTLQKNGRNLGLWLYSRRFNRSAPAFVFQRLGVQDPSQLAAGNPPPTAPAFAGGFQTPQQAPAPPSPDNAPF